MAREDESRGWTRDATGRRAQLLDPELMLLQCRDDPIPQDTLRSIVKAMDTSDHGPRAVVWCAGVLLVPFILIAIVQIASIRIWGETPLTDVLGRLMGVLGWALPFVGGAAVFIMMRRQRMPRVRRAMLGGGHCPHCGYRIAGLGAEKGTVRCPECGCAWPSGEVGTAR